jgi:4-hydroxy-2-oxovalerate aldolase
MVNQNVKLVEIVETTIRDGSYEAGFQFDHVDVITIASLLDAAGLRYIEVGHGMGLGVDLLDYYPHSNYSAFKDEKHLKSARQVVRKAKLGALLGMTFHDWNGIESCLRIAAECGLDFIRLAFSAATFEKREASATIQLAKQLGLTVSVNFMRSYSVPPEMLAQKAADAEDMGADWVYLVDSAGCWFPDDVKLYTQAIQSRVKCRIGFHGHNNLSFAIANCLAAMEAGASLLDCSLQGLGRATGNAQTEILVQILQNKYYLEQQIDRVLVNALGRNFIRRYVRAGFDPTHILAGTCKLHSGVIKGIHEQVKKYGLHIDQILDKIGIAAEEAGVLEKKNVPHEIIESICQKAKSYNYTDYLSHIATALSIPEASPQTLSDFLEQLKIPAFRDGLLVTLFVVGDQLWPFKEATIFRSEKQAIACFPVKTLIELKTTYDCPWVNQVIVDEDLLTGSFQKCHKAVSFIDILAEAAVHPTSSSALIAISNLRLKRAIKGRLWCCTKVSEYSEYDAAEFLPVNSQHEYIFIEGATGTQLLEREDFWNKQRASGYLTIIGSTPIDIKKIISLAGSGWIIRVPDFSPLLAAKLSINSEVKVITSESDLLLEDIAIIIDDKLIAKKTKEFIGSLASFTSKKNSNKETWDIIHSLRLKVLFSELNSTS